MAKVPATSNFPIFIQRVLSHEGGFTKDRKDRGNWTSGIVGQGQLKGTKYGISAMKYPSLDIENLTRDQAIQLYFDDFWMPAKCEQLPKSIQFQMLDAAVNHGISNGGNVKRWLQRAALVADDGWIGPITLAAVQAQNPADLVLNFNAERIEFYTGIGTFTTYGVGWMRRVAKNLRYAAEDN